MELLKEIKAVKDNYEGGSIEIIEGLDFNQFQLLKQIEFYSNSKYLESNDNEPWRPFFNIVNYRVNVAIRATDLDTKDINVFTEDPEYYIRSMIFNRGVKNWMREAYFSKTLNDLNEIRVRYGGVLVKRRMENGKLFLEIPQWKNLIVDPVDIKNGIKIQKHYLTPIEIYNKRDVWEGVNENWEKIEKVLKKQYGKNATNSDRVCVYEVEGIFEKEDETEEEGYTLQQHFILGTHDGNMECILHSEDKKETDYKYLSYDEVSGRSLGRGVVEDGLEAQIATNEAILAEKEIMDIASKTLFYTDSDILQNNALRDTETGDFIKVGKGEQIGIFNTTPSSLPQLENIIQKWEDQYNKTASTFEAITGETMPSGTPFRAIAIQNQEAQSLFNYRKEEMGIFLNELFTDWIIPHIKKNLQKQDTLTADFDDEELEIIDEELIKLNVRDEVKKRMLNMEATTVDDYNTLKQLERERINKKLKKRRFLELPKDYFKDVEFKLDILITGEQINKSAVFETMANIMQTVAQNPQILQDPTLRKIFNKIIELSGIGISPAQLATPQVQPQATPAPQLNPGLNPEAQPQEALAK